MLGYLIYRGALKINLSRFFTWTGAFLIVIAAGVLAYGVHDLQEARFLPGLNNLAFDVSETIPPTSWYGTLLKGVFNFSPATTVLRHRLAALLRPNTHHLPLPETPARAGRVASHTRPSWGIRKEMIMTRPSRRAGEFAVPARALVLASSCVVFAFRFWPDAPTTLQAALPVPRQARIPRPDSAGDRL